MTEPTPASQSRVRQILLVDDDTAFTDFFKEFLLAHRPGEWAVYTADHYEPALACIRERPIDLMVLDITMPIMDGLQFLRLLKRTHPELPVVILTSMGTEENRTQARQDGAALFFDKTEISGSLEKIYAALESLAAAPAEGFRGVLRQVGLPDVLQMECLGRKSSVLEIASQGSSGRIYIEDGSIIHAEHGPIQGEPALFQLLRLQGGEFHLKPYDSPARRTIDGHWESLVMEAARLRDEATAAEFAGSAGDPGAALPPLPEAAPPDDRQVEEIVLCSEGGQLLYEWQATEADKRIKLLEQFGKFSGLLAKPLALGRTDRLEIETKNSRVVLLLQADRKMFVRLAVKPGPT